MIKKDVKAGKIPTESEQSAAGNKINGELPVKKSQTKKKRRHNSALAAAAQGESAVSAANARSSGAVGFEATGTNLSYKEDGGVL